MTYSNASDRHPRHANTWPSNIPFQSDASDVTDWLTRTMASDSSDLSHSQGGDTSQSQSQSQSRDTSQSGTEGSERDQTHLVEEPPPSGEVASPSGADSSSTTPNARASRLFRERRKEREKILRQTIAELAERNATLEAMLLRNGIVPPPAATLRHDLSLHRSQRIGGPPIHIPGVTMMRPPLVPSLSEPSFQHDIPSTGATQGHPSTAGTQPSNPLLGGARSYSLEEQNSFGPTGWSTNFLDNLASAHDQTQSLGEGLALGAGDPHHSGSRRSHHQYPAASANRSAGLPAQHDNVYGSMNSRPVETVFTHYRTPSDSALLAKLPALTPAEHRIIAARGGHLAGHSMPMAALPEGTQAGHGHPNPLQGLQVPLHAPHAWIPHPSADPLQRDTRLFAPHTNVQPISGSGAPVTPDAPSRCRTTGSSGHAQHLGSIASDLVRQTAAGRGVDTLHSPIVGSTPSGPQAATSPTPRAFPHPEWGQMPATFPIGPSFSAQNRAGGGSQGLQTDPSRTYTAHGVLEDGHDAKSGSGSESESETPSPRRESKHLTEDGEAAPRPIKQPTARKTKTRSNRRLSLQLPSSV